MEEVAPQNFVERGKPDVAELISSFKATVGDLGNWISQQRTNYRVRHCIWSSQSDDGKKHGNSDDPAFPWEGASDLRVFLVDQLITADSALLLTSLRKSSLAAVPVEAGDMARSKLVSAFMRWLIFSQMDEFADEAELLANYYLEKGIGALGVFWETRITNVLTTITVEQIEELAPELAGYIQDKEYASDLTDLVQVTFPQLSRRKARKMVTALRNKGVAEVGMPEVECQRPVLRAYSLDTDLFLPPDTTDIQKAPYIFEQKWYTPEQLRAKVVTDGWDEGFVEHLIEVVRDDPSYEFGTEWDQKQGLEGSNKTGTVRLICAYYRRSDEDGVPEVCYTVFHPDVSDIPGAQAYAVHDKLDYKPSRYPFVVFSRERLSRRILETRGYPEVAKGWQDQIKIERDTRIDRASLSTNPPFLYRMGRKPAAWGPGAQIPVQRREDYGWAEIPAFDQGSIEVEMNLMQTARKYFGRPNGEEDRVEAGAIQRFMVQKWLGFWRDVFRQVWSLYKQYGPDEQFFRVVGADPKPDLMVKGDDHEKYDFYLEFDVPGIDPEYQLKKLESMAKMAMQYDRTGRTDWSALLGELMSGIDPVVSERILVPQEEATEKEVQEEKELLTQIWSGMDVDLVPPFNPQLRGQVFQNYLTGSETIPARDVQQRLQTDESFRARVEKHQKQIQMQMMQQQNAQIGRTGATPGNM
jgi:hypothetical protein